MRLVMHKLTAFIKKSSIVFIRLNNKIVATTQTCRNRKILRHTTNQKTRVTPLPARPLVSRDTRTMPSEVARTGAVQQAQALTGRRHDGHMRPLSVE